MPRKARIDAPGALHHGGTRDVHKYIKNQLRKALLLDLFMNLWTSLVHFILLVACVAGNIPSNCSIIESRPMVRIQQGGFDNIHFNFEYNNCTEKDREQVIKLYLSRYAKRHKYKTFKILERYMDKHPMVYRYSVKLTK